MNTDINREREFREKMIDTVLQHATEVACEEMMNEVPVETETVEFSERHLKNMEKVFAAAGKKKTRRIRPKYLILVAVIAALLAAVGTVATNPKILNHFMQTSDTNTEIRYVEQKTVNNTYSTEEVTLGYIPVGMQMVETTRNDVSITLKFQNENSNFALRLTRMEAVANLNTEQAEVEKIRIHNLDAFLIERNKFHHVKWYTEEYTYTLYGNIGREELIKIAENIA